LVISDFDRLFAGLDGHECVTNRGLGGELTRRVIGIYVAGVAMIDRVEQTQGNITTDRLIGGPQSGAYCCSGAVDANDYRWRGNCFSHNGLGGRDLAPLFGSGCA
jgi:hypothetical protein